MRAFHAAALGAGAKDNGGPGVRAEYHDAYYAAFVLSLGGAQHRASVSKTNPEPRRYDEVFRSLGGWPIT